MHILALDTTTRTGSAAVARDAVLLHEHSGDPALTHGQRLPGDIERALEGAGVGLTDLGLLAVATGPGSFTGLRVGIAAIQGLAVARGLRVVPVSTLEALARVGSASAGPDALIAAWLDGQRGEIFGALYDNALREVRPAVAGSPRSVLEGWAVSNDRPVVFIGDGAVRYQEVIADRVGSRADVLAPPLLAGTIARIAFEQPHRAVAPDEIVPIYVRKSDAELARDARPSPEPRPFESLRVVPSQVEGRAPSPIIERVTSTRDLDAVAELEALCFTNPWTREMLEREIRQSNVARVYVLRDDAGGIAAFCTCWLIVDELHINTIAVDPEKRRAGLATRLMEQVIAECAREGMVRATLEVRASNTAARALYARLGFIETGLRPGYYTKPDEDGIVLWREIAS